MLDVLSSEWTKVRSVRSTYLTLLAVVAVAALMGYLATSAEVAEWPAKLAGERAVIDPTADSILGTAIAQLAFGVLGVLTITSEYTTGMIRTTFAAVPQRRTVVVGKAVVIGAVTLTAGMLLVFGAFFLGQLVLSRRNLEISLTAPGVFRAVGYAGCYLLIVTMIGFGLGAIIRNTAGAITALFGLVFVVPELVRALPAPWASDLGRYLPFEAAHSATSVQPVPGTLTPTLSIIVCASYAVVTVGTALVLVTRRDA